jgi:hypothetical protein
VLKQLLLNYPSNCLPGRIKGNLLNHLYYLLLPLILRTINIKILKTLMQLSLKKDNSMKASKSLRVQRILRRKSRSPPSQFNLIQKWGVW